MAEITSVWGCPVEVNTKTLVLKRIYALKTDTEKSIWNRKRNFPSGIHRWEVFYKMLEEKNHQKSSQVVSPVYYNVDLHNNIYSLVE